MYFWPLTPPVALKYLNAKIRQKYKKYKHTLDLLFPNYWHKLSINMLRLHTKSYHLALLQYHQHHRQYNQQQKIFCIKHIACGENGVFLPSFSQHFFIYFTRAIFIPKISFIALIELEIQCT